MSQRLECDNDPRFMGKGGRLICLWLVSLFSFASVQSTEPQLIRVSVADLSEQKSHIANLDLEEYLPGVVSSEMSARFPLEALKAQAVAARTYARNKSLQKKTADFDIRSTFLDQSYDPDWERKLAPYFVNKIRLAVRDTHNQILVTKNNERAQVFFHADCAGQTESASAVWGESESASVTDPFCANRKKSIWQYTVNREDLGVLLGLGHQEKILSVEVGEQTSMGRAKQILIYTDRRSWPMNANSFRLKVGPQKVRSTLFSVKNKNDLVFFSGRGYGHGVGLCQRGAHEWALRGWTYQMILKHYYPDFDLSQAPIITRTKKNATVEKVKI